MGSDIQQPSDIFFSRQRVRTKEGWHFFWVYCKSVFNCVYTFTQLDEIIFRGAFSYNLCSQDMSLKYSLGISETQLIINNMFEIWFWYSKDSRYWRGATSQICGFQLVPKILCYTDFTHNFCNIFTEIHIFSICFHNTIFFLDPWKCNRLAIIPTWHGDEFHNQPIDFAWKRGWMIYEIISTQCAYLCCKKIVTLRKVKMVAWHAK